MNRAILQTALPIFVFSILLVRETLSYLLFLFPGEGLLWYVSFAMGHKLFPLQMFVGTFVSGYFAKVSLLLILVAACFYGWICRHLFARALTCHAAFVMVCLHGVFTLSGAYSRSASLEPSMGQYLLVFDAHNIWSLLLALALFCGCLQTHISYFQGIRREPQMQQRAAPRA